MNKKPLVLIIAIIALVYSVTASITWDQSGLDMISINLTGCCSASGLNDTNESIRFDFLTGTDCAAGQLVIGINTTGGVLCVDDTDTDTQLSDAQIQDLGFIKLVNVSGATDTKWIVDNPYLYNDSDTIYFNISQLSTIFFNATAIEVVTGTGQGVLADLQTHNSISYNVSEVNSDFDFRVNFTGVTGFNQIVYRYKTDDDEIHIMHVHIWSYDDSTWHHVAYEGEIHDYGFFSYPIFDSDEHISGGVVQLQFITTNPTPNTAHKWQFDWVAISDGPATPSSSESDPFSIHRDGNTPLSGNWNAGAFNITADYFIGDGSLLTGVSDTNLSAGGTINGNLIISSPYNLTAEGHLIINNLTTSEDVRPNLNNIYSLGNSTRWYNKLYVTDIHNQKFYGNYINASEINTTEINSRNVNSSTVEIDDNLTLGGYRIIRQDDNLAMILT